MEVLYGVGVLCLCFVLSWMYIKIKQISGAPPPPPSSSSSPPPLTTSGDGATTTWNRGGVDSIPGAIPSNPKTGNVSDMAAAGSLHQYLLNLHKAYGNICTFWYFDLPVVSLGGPALFKDSIQLFDRPEPLFALFKPLIGANSLQYLNGIEGREKRKLLDTFFSTAATKRVYPVFLQVVNDAISRRTDSIEKSKGGSVIIDVGQEMFHIAIRAVVLSILGPDITEEVIQKILDAYDACWLEMADRLTAKQDYDGKREKEFQKNKAYMYDTVQSLIETRRARKLQDGEKGNFLDFLLHDTNYSDEQIQADAVTYMIGGFHTTANFVTWALYFIARDHNIQRRVFEEIRDVSGFENEIEFEALGKLDYLAMVLNETLRYIVLAPYAARYSEKDETIGGYRIPAKTMIMHGLGVVSHNPEVWNTPDEFNPDHFSPKESASRHPLGFAPFGVGNRMCPASRYAMIESKCIIAKLVQRFEFAVYPEDQEVVPEWGLVATPKNPIHLSVTQRYHAHT